MTNFHCMEDKASFFEEAYERKHLDNLSLIKSYGKQIRDCQAEAWQCDRNLLACELDQ